LKSIPSQAFGTWSFKGYMSTKNDTIQKEIHWSSVKQFYRSSIIFFFIFPYSNHSSQNLSLYTCGSKDGIQNICMDKGHDYADIRQFVKNYGYTAHIRSRGEENIKMSGLEQEGGL
jgi:hypothetical protein